MTRLVYVDRGLFELDLLDREAWLWWLEQMRIDPTLVCVPSWIVIDDDHCTIAYLTPTRHDTPMIDDDDDVDHALRTRSHIITVRLDAPALPLPAGYVVDGGGSFDGAGPGESLTPTCAPQHPPDPKNK